MNWHRTPVIPLRTADVVRQSGMTEWNDRASPRCLPLGAGEVLPIDNGSNDLT